MSNGAAISETKRSRPSSRIRIARRTGSESAANTASSRVSSSTAASFASCSGVAMDFRLSTIRLIFNMYVDNNGLEKIEGPPMAWRPFFLRYAPSRGSSALAHELGEERVEARALARVQVDAADLLDQPLERRAAFR